MPIETVAIIGKGAVGLLHGSKIAKAVGSKHLEYVMDDERYLRHRADRIVINGEDQTFTTISPSSPTSTPTACLRWLKTASSASVRRWRFLLAPSSSAPNATAC